VSSSGTQVTILCDDQAGDRLVAEHGLSLWIETCGQRILFDTGQTGSILEQNARVCGTDLAKTDALVLSHGHYDHTGGIPLVAERSRELEVYCHPDAVLPRYRIRDGAAKPIGMPLESKAVMERLPAERLHWIVRPTSLSEKIGLTGFIPRQTSFEDTGGPFCLDPAGREPDPLVDDLALWIQADGGLIVVVGCCHAGVVNTLSHVRQLSDGSRIRAVVGGFHLLNAAPQRLDQTMAALRSVDPEVVVACHCTGQRAIEALRETLGSRVVPAAAGSSYQF